MLHPETHLVTHSNGVRPAGPPDQCLYSKRLVGTEHAADCVCRKRTVVVRGVFELTISATEDNTIDYILSYLNNGSQCHSNPIGRFPHVS